MNASSDCRLSAPHIIRNRAPILAELRRVLPPQGLILEIASGTGEHAAYFAQMMPSLVWQPTDRDPAMLASIVAHRQATEAPNLLAPLHLDVLSPHWPVDYADAIVCINMIHIASWSATEELMTGAQRILAGGGVLYLYGAFLVDGQHTAESNREFDKWLRSQDPGWGVRDLSEVADVARRHGFTLSETVQMPANNLSVVLRRAVETTASE